MTQRKLRGAPRYPICLDAKFLVRGEREGEGVLLDISESGFALLGETGAIEGDEIVIYPESLGRLTGSVVRVFEGGVGAALALSTVQRETIRDRIDAAASGGTYLRLSERRAHGRMRYNLETTAHVTGSDEKITCTIIDMSRSGCLLMAEVIPLVGAEVAVGALYGEVVRTGAHSFAVEFRRPAKGSATVSSQAKNVA